MQADRRAARPAEPAVPWRVKAARALEFRPKETVALVALGALVVTGALVAFVRARPAAVVEPPAAIAAPASPGPQEGPSELVVHVAGAVRSPGVVRLAAGARVIDAIDAAGGARPEADLDAINLARPVADGERIYVPLPGEAPPEDPGGSGGGGGSGGKVNINTASVAELDAALPGVGPVLAQRIVDYREQHGPFRAVRDLMKVDGIGAKKFASLEPLVTV